MEITKGGPSDVILSSIKIWMLIIIIGGFLGNIIVIVLHAPALISQIIFQVVGIVILVLVLRNYSFNDDNQNEAEEPLNIVIIGVVYWLLYIGIFFPIGEFMLFIVHLFETKTVSSYQGLTTNPYEAYLFLLSFVLLAPIFEELMFRKYIVGRLLQTNLTPQATLLVSTFIFTIIHTFADIRYGTVGFATYHFVIILGIGWVLGAIYIRTRNIIYPILIHGLTNTYGSLGTILEIVYPPSVPGMKQFDQLFPWFCLIFSVIMLMIYRNQVISLIREYSEKLTGLITKRIELLITPIFGFLIIQLLFLGLSYLLPGKGTLLSTLLVSTGYAVSFLIAYLLTRSVVEVTET